MPTRKPYKIHSLRKSSVLVEQSFVTLIGRIKKKNAPGQDGYRWLLSMQIKKNRIFSKERSSLERTINALLANLWPG